MRRRFAIVSADQRACLRLVEAAEGRRGRRFSHVMKLRTDQQVCSPLDAGALLAPALERHAAMARRLGRQACDPSLAAREAAATGAAAAAAAAPGEVVVKQRDHWAFMPRAAAEVYFGAQAEVASRCVPRRAYDRYPLPRGSSLDVRLLPMPRAAAVGRDGGGGQRLTEGRESGPAVEALDPTPFPRHRCHWQSAVHPWDVPNECLLDHWLATSGLPFREALVPTCIRKGPAVRGEPCPQVSFNQNKRLDTSAC